MSGIAWSKKDEIRLRGLYPDLTASKVAEILGCNVKRIYSKAHQLGLKKSPEFEASLASGRLDGKRGSTTRFKKGNEAWNKGLKGVCLGGVETQFKKGSMPHNHLPVGTIRVTSEGYHQRKINDTRNKKQDWINMHWELWIKHNGAVPDKHIIRFINGDRSDIRIENLVCVSMAENAKMNITSLPPEIKKINQLRGVLARQINKTRKRA